MNNLYKKIIFLLFFSIFINFAFLSFTIYAIDEKSTNKPQEVYIGIYLNNINDLDVKSCIYTADFYLWFRWKGNIDPTQTFEFKNTVEHWGTTQVNSYEGPKIANGYKYQIYHIQGKFNNKFILTNYPLDRQNILIEIEDREYNEQNLIYKPDLEDIKYNPDLIIPGWKILHQNVEVFSRKYNTSFGDPTVKFKSDTYSCFRYSLTIERPKVLYLFKMLLPIIIVLLSTFVIFFIHPKYVDARTCIAITTIVSITTLQITVSSDFGYMVLIDKIYNLSYIMVLLTLIETIITTYWYDKGFIDKAINLDKTAWKVLNFIYIFLTTLIIIWH